MAVESQLLEGMRETGTGGAGAVVVLRLTAVVWVGTWFWSGLRWARRKTFADRG